MFDLLPLVNQFLCFSLLKILSLLSWCAWYIRQGCARGALSRDQDLEARNRDVDNSSRGETETKAFRARVQRAPHLFYCNSIILLWMLLAKRTSCGFLATARLSCCLTGPFFQSYSKLGYPRLGRSPKVDSWELLWQKFCRLDALPVPSKSIKALRIRGFLNGMRYINTRFTYLFTYLLNYIRHY